MSEEALARIENVLTDIQERLRRLEESARLAERDPRKPAKGLLGFLDQFRAGEALGEASAGAWIEACRVECLKGGLRTVQMREGMHAILLEQRLKELGGSPRAEIPPKDFERAMRDAASREKSDAQKVKEFAAQFRDPDEAIRPILEFADRLDEDPETQFLLRTIAQDERATVAFIQEANALLNPEA